MSSEKWRRGGGKGGRGGSITTAVSGAGISKRGSGGSSKRGGTAAAGNAKADASASGQAHGDRGLLFSYSKVYSPKKSAKMEEHVGTTSSMTVDAKPDIIPRQQQQQQQRPLPRQHQQALPVPSTPLPTNIYGLEQQQQEQQQQHHTSPQESHRHQPSSLLFQGGPGPTGGVETGSMNMSSSSSAFSPPWYGNPSHNLLPFQPHPPPTQYPSPHLASQFPYPPHTFRPPLSPPQEFLQATQESSVKGFPLQVGPAFPFNHAAATGAPATSTVPGEFSTTSGPTSAGLGPAGVDVSNSFKPNPPGESDTGSRLPGRQRSANPLPLPPPHVSRPEGDPHSPRLQPFLSSQQPHSPHSVRHQLSHPTRPESRSPPSQFIPPQLQSHPPHFPPPHPSHPGSAHSPFAFHHPMDRSHEPSGAGSVVKHPSAHQAWTGAGSTASDTTMVSFPYANAYVPHLANTWDRWGTGPGSSQSPMFTPGGSLSSPISSIPSAGLVPGSGWNNAMPVVPGVIPTTRVSSTMDDDSTSITGSGSDLAPEINPAFAVAGPSNVPGFSDAGDRTYRRTRSGTYSLNSSAEDEHAAARHRSMLDLTSLAGPSSAQMVPAVSGSDAMVSPTDFADMASPEELAELARLERGGRPMRKERRKLQNRLAQRAFRARSRVLRKDAASHLADVEERNASQQSELERLHRMVDQLEQENKSLKRQWQSS